MSDWQPIETAPKDRAVLLWVPENLCVYACVWWDLDTWGVWRIWGGDRRQNIQRATHWRPLPEPPA